MSEMLELLAQVIGAALLIFGTIFCVLGVYGLVYFPDTYNRLHATGKVMTFGAGAVALSLVFLASPRAGLKGLAVAALLLLTAPLVTHALARTAYRRGVPLASEPVRDDLAEDRRAGRPQEGKVI